MNAALAFVAPSPVAAPAQPVAAPAALTPTSQRSYAELARAPRSRRALLVGIAGLHVLAFIGLSHLQDIRRTMAHVTPVVVRLITPAEPPLPLPPVPVEMPKLNVPVLTMIDPPLIAVAAPPAPSPVFAALPTPPQTPVVVQPAPTPVVQATPQPPAIKHIPASAVRYLRPPNTAVPLMSRRLKESGIVYLRVVVDINGMPREITLSKSSGFARLDEQALQDMRTARFVPYTENGQPVEWEVTAPMSYELDR